MESASSGSPGFVKSLAALGDSLLGALQERVELVSIEVAEEKRRFARLAVLLGAAVFAGGMALAFATLAVVYLLWDSARLAALGGFALLYGVAFAWITAVLRRRLSGEPRPFEATIGSLREDRACIRARN